MQRLVELRQQAAVERAPVADAVLVGHLRVLLRGGVSGRRERGEQAQRQRADPQPGLLLLQRASPVLIG